MIAKRSLWVISNSILGALLGYVGLFVMARYMGDELVGAREYVLSIAFLLALITRLGFPTTHARMLGRGDDVGTANGTYLAIKIVLTALFALVASAGLWLWFDGLGRTSTDATEQALWLGVAVVVVRSLRDVATNTFRGLGRIPEREAILFTNTLTTVVLTAMAGVAYAHSHGRWTPLPAVAERLADALQVTAPVTHVTGLHWLLGAFLAGEIAAFLVAVALWLRGRLPVSKPQRHLASQYFQATLPIMLVTTAGVLMRRVDQVMIGFWHDASELGQYAGATKLTELVLILAAGVRVVLLPVLARLQQEGRREQLAATLVQVERWISILVWPAAIVAWLAPTLLLHVALSDAFLPAAPVLMVLMVHSLLTSLTAPLRTKALGTGFHKPAAKIALAALLVNMVLNAALIPTWGALGAAWATVAAGTTMFVAYRHRAADWVHHPYFSKHLRHHLLAAAGTYLIGWLLLPDGLGRFYHVLALGAGVVVVYMAILLLLGELHRGDWEQLKRLASGRSVQEPEPGEQS